MADILHRIAIQSSTKDAYGALAMREGLAGWWTTDTHGSGAVGEVIEFRFGPRGVINMKVLELVPRQRVLWQVVGGPADWIGTKVSFELAQQADFSILLFKHQGWKEPNEFMHHCSTKWAVFLMSLKSQVETGKGTPYPNDVHISDQGD